MMTVKINTRIEPHPFSTDDFIYHNPFALEIINHGINILQPPSQLIHHNAKNIYLDFKVFLLYSEQ